MNDRFESARSGGGVFEVRRVENGKTVIYRTDNATDFIRHNVETAIADYGLEAQVKAKVEDAGDGWTRVEITYAADLGEDGVNIWTDFEAAFSERGKKWYDCREEGERQSPEGTTVWYVVKHNHGPWL